MRRSAVILGGTALALCVAGCGGYGGNAGNPSAPSGNQTPPADAIVINIVSENGAQSFSPNPSSIPNGRTVVWHNIDRTIHHGVLDDRSVDTGNLEPGAFSAPMTLGAVGGYHCSIHPDMVGTLTR
jgi:plastocyanin